MPSIMEGIFSLAEVAPNQQGEGLAPSALIKFFSTACVFPFRFIICAPNDKQKINALSQGEDQWRNLTEIQRTSCSTRWTRHQMLISSGKRYAVLRSLHYCWLFLS